MSTIAELNDQLRTTLDPQYGLVMLTSSITDRGLFYVAVVMNAVRTFNQFNEDNNPHLERDCSTFKVLDDTFMFKIDYYSLDMKYHSPDPSNPDVTKRVMTIMRASEY